MTSTIKRQSTLYTGADLNLAVSKSATVTTTASGTYNLSTAFGVNTQNSVILKVYAQSSAHPNGIVTETLSSGSSYWVRLKDFGTGALVKSESVTIYATYLVSA